MQLNLHDVIHTPGASIKFAYEPDLSDGVGGCITAVKPGPKAVGKVRNTAGLLFFEADLDVTVSCVCARCLKEFELPIHRRILAVLSEDESEDDPDVYALDGESVDVDEIIHTDFILNLNQSPLCKEDCKGLCPKCGADLNEGPCGCKKETDPRLAVLEQLLESE